MGRQDGGREEGQQQVEPAAKEEGAQAGAQVGAGRAGRPGNVQRPSREAPAAKGRRRAINTISLGGCESPGTSHHAKKCVWQAQLRPLLPPFCHQHAWNTSTAAASRPTRHQGTNAHSKSSGAWPSPSLRPLPAEGHSSRLDQCLTIEVLCEQTNSSDTARSTAYLGPGLLSPLWPLLLLLPFSQERQSSGSVLGVLAMKSGSKYLPPHDLPCPPWPVSKSTSLSPPRDSPMQPRPLATFNSPCLQQRRIRMHLLSI